MRRLQADNPYWQVSGEMIISVLQDIKKGKGHGGGGNGSGTANPPPPPSSPTGTRIRNQQQQLLQQPQHQGLVLFSSSFLTKNVCLINLPFSLLPFIHTQSTHITVINQNNTLNGTIKMKPCDRK